MENSRIITFLERWKQKLGPFSIDAPEWFFMRIGLAGIVWMLFPLTLFPNQPKPNGLAKLGMDFTWLNDPAKMEFCTWLLLGALILYVANRALWLALPIMTALMIATGTLTNSQSLEVSHHSQPVTLILLVQTIWLFVAMIRRVRGKPATDDDPDPSIRVVATKRWFTLAVYFSIQTMCAAYMVSVVSKMVLSDGRWIGNSVNFPIQLVKNDLADHYNVVNGPSQDKESTFQDDAQKKAQQFFIDYPNIGRALLTSGMLLEAFCFLALLSRWISCIYGVMLVIFHEIISLVMGLTFTYNMLLLAVFFIGVPWLVSRPIAALLAKRQSA